MVTPAPAPWIVIPFLTRNVLVQLTVPAGMITVAPSVAEAIAAATSDSDALFALILVAASKRETERIRMIATETRVAAGSPGTERRTSGVPLNREKRNDLAITLFGVYEFLAIF